MNLFDEMLAYLNKQIQWCENKMIENKDNMEMQQFFRTQRSVYKEIKSELCNIQKKY